MICVRPAQDLFRAVLFGLALVLVACTDAPTETTVSAESGRDLLVRAVQAEQRLAWQGQQSVALSRGDGVERAQVSMTADGTGRRRRQHLSGPQEGLEVITTRERAYQRRARQGWTERTTPGGAALDTDPASLDRLLGNYPPQVYSAEPIAGRAAVRVDLARPAEPPRRRLWLDRDSGLILRDQQFNQRGELLAETTVTDLQVGAQPPINLPFAATPAAGGPLADLVHFESAQALADHCRWSVEVPAYLPPGYWVEGFYARESRAGRCRPVVVLTDGLVPVTIFDRGLRGQRRGGPGRGTCEIRTGASANMATLAGAEREWVVLGDLPGPSLQLIAESLP